MNALPLKRPWPLAWAVRLATCGLALLVTAGCAVLPAPAPMDRASAAPEVLACIDWFAALDAQTDSAGVRDAGATRVAGFAQLRLDRFTASLGDTLTASAGQTAPATQSTQAAAMGSPQEQAALVQRMQQLDTQARAYEIANLPAPVRTQLAAGAATDTTTPALLQHTQKCADRLSTFDLASPARMASLLARLHVPDDYATSARVLGLYALTRLPFAMGVRKHEAERQAVFAQADLPPTKGTRLRLSPPTTAREAHISRTHLSRMLAPAPGDPFNIPAPSAQDLDLLFAHYAPAFAIDVASDDDKPGALAWQEGTLTVDTAQPVLYRQTATTRYGAHTLLQLVYTLWFPARPAAPGNPSDILAGALDGLVFRVTLAPDGTPLVYDSMHPCGCYHEFFPTPAATPKSAPARLMEWAFIPQTLPALGAQDQLVIHLAARTHYIDRIRIESAQRNTDGPHYTWRDYNSLRSLAVGTPTANPSQVSADTANTQSTTQRRSAFGPSGFIAGTDRAERYLF